MEQPSELFAAIARHYLLLDHLQDGTVQYSCSHGDEVYLTSYDLLQWSVDSPDFLEPTFVVRDNESLTFVPYSVWDQDVYDDWGTRKTQMSAFRPASPVSDRLLVPQIVAEGRPAEPIVARRAAPPKRTKQSHIVNGSRIAERAPEPTAQCPGVSAEQIKP